MSAWMRAIMLTCVRACVGFWQVAHYRNRHRILHCALAGVRAAQVADAGAGPALRRLNRQSVRVRLSGAAGQAHRQVPERSRTHS